MSQIKRILLVDDNAEIHKDFDKILSQNKSSPLDEDEAILFGRLQTPKYYEAKIYQIDSAYQGEEALELVKKSLMNGSAYALAFIDMRMPPGWDGIETIKRIWKVDPSIQMVICSAYSDHSWEVITRELGNSDNLLILKKPFEVIEIKQLAASLTRKWEMFANLHSLVKFRTAELENLYSLTQATLESTEEGIIAIGLNEHILMHNQKFLNQWGIAKELLETEKASLIFQHLAKKVVNPVFFIQKMNDLITEPSSKNVTEWHLETGVILALYAHPQFLHEKMIGVVYSFQDITERKKLEQQLLHQATHDTLTGLPNRALLQDRIKQMLAHAKRFNLYVAVLLLDLDSFKEVNDTLGHKAGDILLKYQAKRLTDFVQGSRYLVIDFSHPWLKSTRQRAKFLAATVLRPARCAERASVCLPQ